MNATLKRLLVRAGGAAERLGTPAYLVGGCVRDRLLRRPTKDVDVAVEGPVAPLLKALGARKAEAFDRFGTARWPLAGGGRLDFARTRKETYPSPGALPVVSPASIREDLYRRDFTVNALAEPLVGKGELLDPFDGRRDLDKRELRILHTGSFKDDPTRVFRAARFAGRFGFKLEADTQETLLAALRAEVTRTVSRERLREELLRILEERNPAPALGLLREWGAIETWHPGLRWEASDLASPDPWVRLGLLALRLGPEAGPFLDGLHLERGERRPIDLALKASAKRSVLHEPLPELSRAILRRGLLGLPPSALKPPLAGGDDLKKLGFAPGPEFGRRLEALSHAQWSGAVRTRAQALAFLKRAN